MSNIDMVLLDTLRKSKPSYPEAFVLGWVYQRATHTDVNSEYVVRAFETMMFFITEGDHG